MCLALPNWERPPLGVGGEGRGGSEPERLCLGPTALAEGEAKGCPSIPSVASRHWLALLLSRAPSIPLPHPVALEVSFVACP